MNRRIRSLPLNIPQHLNKLFKGSWVKLMQNLLCKKNQIILLG